MAGVYFSCPCGLDVNVRGVADVAALDLVNRLVEQHADCVEWAREPDENTEADAQASG